MLVIIGQYAEGTAIKGTNFSVTCAIRLIPPITINPSKTDKTAPVIYC